MKIGSKARVAPRTLPAAVAILTSLVVSVPMMPSAALALYGDRLDEFGVDGSVRTTTLAVRNYKPPIDLGVDNKGDSMAQTTLRLVAGGQPLAWLKFEVHGVQMLTMSTFGGAGADTGGILGATGSAPTWRLHPVSAQLGEDPGDVTATAVLDRCELRFASESVDVVIGRQAISFGKAWFWNPLDVFAAFGAVQMDRDYKPGVDAVRIEVPMGEFSGLTLVAAMGDLDVQERWRQLGVIGRAFTTVGGFDVALQGGLLRGGWQAGAALSGEIEPVDVRAEVAWNQPRKTDGGPGGHLVGVFGVSRRFESELSLAVEHLLHNGGPNDRNGRMLLLADRQLLQASRNVTGLMASYPLLPVLSGSLATLMSWDDQSLMVQPGLTWSAADEVDVVLGGLLAFGERPTLQGLALQFESEFGAWPHFLYLQMKAHF